MRRTPRALARSLPAFGALMVLTAVRLVVAGTAPLSPDEAYYWVWSHALAPGYLDHPPMVALWVRAGTALAGQSAFGVRLLAPLSAAAGSMLLAAAGNLLFPSRRPGVWAAILLNATPMLAAGAVTMTPDTPLLFFWSAALWALARAASGGGVWWLVVGGAGGLALDSKYTAVLLGIGIGLWLLTPAMRPALRTPWPWAGATLAGALVAPVLLWNAEHDWASVLKQGGRAGDFVPSVRYLGELVAGQLGLASPIIAGLMVGGTGAAMRRWREPGAALLASLTVPGTALFLEHAIGDRVQANWVAVLYPAAALAAAAYAPAWRRPAAALGFALAALLYVQATLGALPLPRAMDPTLRLAGFGALATQAGKVARHDGAAFLASEEYGLAALLAFEQAEFPVLGAEPRWRLFDLPPAGRSGLPPTGVLVLSARRSRGPNPAVWEAIEPLGQLARGRDGVVAETYTLYRVTLRPGAAAALLP